MATGELQIILQQAQQLSPYEQLQLIKHLAEKLSTKTPVTSKSRYLVYGEFAGNPLREMSTEDDFKIAEWNPSESELNGD